MRKIRVFNILTGAILAVSLLAGVSVAGVISVDNASFESPASNESGVFPDNGDKNWAPFNGTDWIENSGTTGVLDPTTTADPAAKDGNQWAFMTGGSRIYQDIGTVTADTTYTVDFWTGNRDGSSIAPLDVELGAGGTGPSDWNSLGSADALGLPQNTGETKFYSLDVATTTDTYTDQTLWLSFVTGGAGGQQVVIDDVSVIPEPATFGLLGLFGLVALLRRKLMKK